MCFNCVFDQDFFALITGLKIPTQAHSSDGGMALTGCTRYGPYGAGPYETSFYSELFVPSSVLRMQPTEHELAWGAALCCVYVRIVEWTEEDMAQYGVNPLEEPHRVEFYDGSSTQYEDDAFVNIAKKVYKDLCAMDIGALDCARETSCTDTALYLYSMDTTDEMTVRAGVLAAVAPAQPAPTNVSALSASGALPSHIRDIHRDDTRDKELGKDQDWAPALGAAIAAALVLVACLLVTCRWVLRTARRLKQTGLIPIAQRGTCLSGASSKGGLVEMSPSPAVVELAE